MESFLARQTTRRLNADPHRMLRPLAAEPDLLEPAERDRYRPGP